MVRLYEKSCNHIADQQAELENRRAPRAIIMLRWKTYPDVMGR